jgi:type I restriction enzyme S subunit
MNYERSAIGYKETEIGVIPEDWQVKELGDILKVVGGGAFKSSDATQLGIKWLKIANVGINKTCWDDESFLPSELTKDNESFLLKEGDCVLALTRPILGRKLKITKLKASDVPALLNQRVGKIEVESKTNIDFTYYLFQKFEIINGLLQSMAGTDPPNLSNKGIYAIKCRVPTNKTEQTAIANALSDMDALISQTEKLIAKKKAIIQGVMQELLNPKEGWVTVKLGDIGKTYGGLSGKSKVDFANGNAFYIPFMNVMSSPTININFFDSVYIKAGEKQNKAQIADLFFNGSSETPEEVGMCSVLTKQIDNLYLNSFCFGYRLNDTQTYNGLFLAYYFRSNFGRAAIFSLAQGATRYNLSKGNFLNMEIPIPEFQKQNEIAGCIADMDSELKKITIKLTKLKQQKQGMMQALLTGKIRLI